VDVESGILTRFRNCGVVQKDKSPAARRREKETKVETKPRHILASTSLAPAFPWTEIDGHLYWDGGLVDNTPLSDAIDAFSDNPETDRVLVVMNMYPLRARRPRNLADVQDRVHELSYGNRFRQDDDSAKRMNDLVATIEALAALVPAGSLTGDLKRQVDRALQCKVIKIIDVDVQDSSESETAPQDPADDQYGLRDFSPPTIERRRERGYQLAMERLSPFF
jgi:NTE family protein